LPGADLLMILPRLVSQGKGSGAIIAEKVNADVNHKLILRDGALVYASSSQQKERIGDLLVKRKHITAEQLDAALQRQKESGGKAQIGKVLVEMKAITADLIPHLIFHQLEIVLYETLVWPEARFQFQDALLDTQTDFIVPITFEWVGGQMASPDNALGSAHSMRMLLQEAQEGLPRLLKVRQFLPDPLEVPSRTQGSGKILLNESQRNVLALVDGQRSLQEIVLIVDGSVPKTYEILLQLWQFQFISLPSRGQTPRKDLTDTQKLRGPAVPNRPQEVAPATKSILMNQARQAVEMVSGPAPQAPPVAGGPDSWLDPLLVDRLRKAPPAKRTAILAALNALVELPFPAADPGRAAHRGRRFGHRVPAGPVAPGR
jgi:hypothetical protein